MSTTPEDSANFEPTYYSEAEKTNYEYSQRLFGGFEYCNPVEPHEEIINIIRESLQKHLMKQRCNVSISLVITTKTFYEIFPPTIKPFGWKRHFTSGGNHSATKGGTEIIKVSKNFKSLNFLFGEKWFGQQYTSGALLVLDTNYGIHIKRKPNCQVKITLQYIGKTAAGCRI